MSERAYGFDSRQPHQTNKIRIRFRLGTGSGFWYSSRDTKISTSATGSSAGPPPSREAHGKRSRQGKARRRYHHDTAAVFLLIRPEFPAGGKKMIFTIFPAGGKKMKFTIVFGLVTIFTIRVMRHKNMVKIGVAPLQNKSIYAYKNFGASKR